MCGRNISIIHGAILKHLKEGDVCHPSPCYPGGAHLLLMHLR